MKTALIALGLVLGTTTLALAQTADTNAVNVPASQLSTPAQQGRLIEGRTVYAPVTQDDSYAREVKDEAAQANAPAR